MRLGEISVTALPFHADDSKLLMAGYAREGAVSMAAR
jgi:hypothetical protein